MGIGDIKYSFFLAFIWIIGNNGLNFNLNKGFDFYMLMSNILDCLTLQLNVVSCLSNIFCCKNDKPKIFMSSFYVYLSGHFNLDVKKFL